jgi:hypothetical protein
MGIMLRQWWVLVLRGLRERLAQTLGEPAPISDDEIDQLGRDSWSLCGDIARYSLLPCTPVQTRGFWHHVSACRGNEAQAMRGERMDDAIGPFIIERVWNAADGQHACRIAWTTEQLRRIGQAIQDNDQTYLAAIETAMRRALEAALAPQRG